MNPKISFCTIAKNEERCIGRCIDSLYGIADEVIVVDTGSADRTAEVAKAHGARVCHFEWIDDFSAAKNYALDQTSGEWVIFLDADEFFPDKSNALAVQAAIRKNHSNTRYNGLYHAIRNYTKEGGPAANPDATFSYNSRVFRKSPSIRFINRIHERITFNGKDLSTLPMDKEESVIDHDGYLEKFIEAKEDRNLALQLAEIEKGNKDPLLFFYTARDYYHKQQFEKALVYFKKYYDTGFKEGCFTVSHFLLHTNTLQHLQHPYEEALQVLRRGMREFPGHPGLTLMNAFVLDNAKRYPQALADYEHGFSLARTFRNPTEYSPNMLKTYHPRFQTSQAQLYLRKGDSNRAFSAAKSALALDSNFSAALNILASVSQKNSDDVLAFLHARYDMSNPATLKGLLTPFSTARPGIVFLTLFERYFQLTQVKDVNMFTMMAAVQEYAAAVDALLARFDATAFEPYALKALAYALVSGNPTLVATAARRTAAPYARVADMALGKRPAMQAGDLAAFVTIMHLALGLSGVTPPLEDFASRAIERFGGDALAQLALLLYSHGCYRDVLDISDMAFERLAGPDNFLLCGSVAEAAVESAYHEGDFALMERYLRFARDHGGHPYFLGSFAAFAAEAQPKGSAKKDWERLSRELLSVDISEENERRKALLLLLQREEDAPLTISER